MTPLQRRAAETTGRVNRLAASTASANVAAPRLSAYARTSAALIRRPGSVCRAVWPFVGVRITGSSSDGAMRDGALPSVGVHEGPSNRDPRATSRSGYVDRDGIRYLPRVRLVRPEC